jgi:glutaredoxin
MPLPPRSLLVVIALAVAASSAWRSHVAAEDGEFLAARVKPGDIRMLSSETCGWCTAARRWMRSEGIAFDECFIERDAQCAADYRAQGGLGTPTLIVRGQRVVGFDRARLVALLGDVSGGATSR